MEFKITFKIDAEEGTLNAYKLCHVLQRHFKAEHDHKTKVLGYKIKRNDFNTYVLEDFSEGETND